MRGCIRFVIQSERGKLLQLQSAKSSSGSMTLVRPNPCPSGALGPVALVIVVCSPTGV